MDFTALRALIETHPTHAATSDEDMVTWLNEATVTRDRASIPSGEILRAVIAQPAEWSALTAQAREMVQLLLTVNGSIPTAAGTPERTALIAILGTNTKTAIAAMIPETVSRAVGAGITETIAEGLVAYARSF
jgi:hypothetical protein